MRRHVWANLHAYTTKFTLQEWFAYLRWRKYFYLDSQIEYIALHRESYIVVRADFITTTRPQTGLYRSLGKG